MKNARFMRRSTKMTTTGANRVKATKANPTPCVSKKEYYDAYYAENKERIQHNNKIWKEENFPTFGEAFTKYKFDLYSFDYTFENVPEVVKHKIKMKYANAAVYYTKKINKFWGER